MESTLDVVLNLFMYGSAACSVVGVVVGAVGTGLALWQHSKLRSLENVDKVERAKRMRTVDHLLWILDQSEAPAEKRLMVARTLLDGLRRSMWVDDLNQAEVEEFLQSARGALGTDPGKKGDTFSGLFRVASRTVDTSHRSVSPGARPRMRERANARPRPFVVDAGLDFPALSDPEVEWDPEEAPASELPTKTLLDDDDDETLRVPIVDQ